MAKRTTEPTIDDEPIVKAEDASEEGDAAGDEEEGGDEDDEDEDEDDEDEDDEDDEDEDDEDDEKSDLTEATLVKALDEMDSIATATANGINPRQRELAAKLAEGTPLTKSEHAEMASLSNSSQLEKSNREKFMDTPQIAQGFEVSDFLDAALTKVAEALDDSRSEMVKSFAEVGEFNRTLAKSLNALGTVIVEQGKKIRRLEKSLAGGATATPEAAPAKGVARTAVGQRVNDSGAIRKSQGGKGNDVQLTKGVILQTLDELLEKSEGKQGVVDGVDLVLESSRYETTQLLSPDAMRLVCKARGIDPTTLGLNA